MTDKNTEFQLNNPPFEKDASSPLQKKIIKIGGRIIDFEIPKVMGIVNVTPDSFFEGSRMKSEDHVIQTVEQMLSEGATFIDLGAYSTRPGAAEVSEEEEIKRLVPVVRTLRKRFPEVILSIDTFRARVAEAAVVEGAHLINDISAGDLDKKMIETVSRLKVPYVFMHMKGSPQTMTKLSQYENVTHEVFSYLSAKINQLREAGISELILDPGFGFAKTIEHNYQLLNQLETFQSLNVPVLAGLSRKTMIWKVLGIENKDALNGTTVLNTIALTKGANILRVHDVKPAMEAITLLNKMKGLTN